MHPESDFPLQALLNEKDIVDWFEVLVTLPTALPESQLDALPSMLPLSSGRQNVSWLRNTADASQH